MENIIKLGLYDLKVISERIEPSENGFILSGSKISIQLPFIPNNYYSHGWQSWSLTTWLDTRIKLMPSLPAIQRSMIINPLYALENKLNGSWLGAVNTPDGNVLFIGALDLESHVCLDGNGLSGFYETIQGDWFLFLGSEEVVFQKYTELLAERFGRTKIIVSPRVWCSWYNLYTEINENILLRILDSLGDMPFDVFQVDDGWQKKIGDWEANEKFPSGMQILADSIKATGRKAGLWLAPLLVVPSSYIYQNHPGWLLHDEKGRLVQAGVNWFENLYALDTTHPEVLAWLTDLMKKVRNWGYDYVKLDFLYAGALPGKRHNNIPRETAYRQGLEVIRKALDEAYLLTCGAPILPSLGLCDAIRVGPDVSEIWNLNLESRLMNNMAVPGIQNAIRTTLNRLWLKPLVHTDPDVVFFHSNNKSLTDEQINLLKNLAYISEFKATSDLPSWLSKSERQELNLFLVSTPEIHRIDRFKYIIDGKITDYSECVKMPKPLNLMERIIRSIIGISVNNSVAMIIFDKYLSLQLRKTLKSRINF
jgi:alpha-galactosidase